MRESLLCLRKNGAPIVLSGSAGAQVEDPFFDEVRLPGLVVDLKVSLVGPSLREVHLGVSEQVASGAGDAITRLQGTAADQRFENGFEQVVAELAGQEAFAAAFEQLVDDRGQEAGELPAIELAEGPAGPGGYGAKQGGDQPKIDLRLAAPQRRLDRQFVDAVDELANVAVPRRRPGPSGPRR